ncbi:hypothetical protein ACU18_14470 [Arthrobacter sp. ZBG10]|uniref:DUF3027 domain-containing protein n=1 Tax=Micrococcaceae TaxID=1268 RepID=UPI00068141A3|nr:MULTISPECIES: DUF3027 domain-containing protein [Micrococcaceae]KNH16216.1 hypothetical protein ACU18_14470 [Arthrobacter sp. ZBG10]KQR03722.1 hypothetical protein ASF72_05200 [Arthrobacter sp. Leaf141]
MNPQAEQPEAVLQDQAADAPAADQATPAAAAPAPAAPKRGAGVPVWRVGKPDAFLAAAVDSARAAVEGITEPGAVGRHLAAKSEGDRLVTHLFESRLAGYQGWQWYAVLTRNSRSKTVTVNELGMLPSGESILAPEWVPWAERVRPEDEQEQAAQEQERRHRDAPAHSSADADAAETDDDVADQVPEGQEHDAVVSADAANDNDDDDADDAETDEDEDSPDSAGFGGRGD